MNKKFGIAVIVAILLGFLSAQIVYSNYRENLVSSDYNAYMIQIGIYDNEENLNNLINNDNYLIMEEEGKYAVYAGITTDLINANKIKQLYEDKEIETKIKPIIIDNIEFLSNLEQYDILISEVDNEDNIISINDVILSSYKEMVLGN